MENGNVVKFPSKVFPYLPMGAVNILEKTSPRSHAHPCLSADPLIGLNALLKPAPEDQPEDQEERPKP